MKRLNYDEVQELLERKRAAEKRRTTSMTRAQLDADEVERKHYHDWLMGKVVGEAPKKRG